MHDTVPTANQQQLQTTYIQILSEDCSIKLASCTYITIPSIQKMRSLNHCIAFVFLCWMRLGTSFTVPITTKNSLNCPTTATIARTNDSQSRFMAQAQVRYASCSRSI